MSDDEHAGRRSIRLPGYDYATPGAYFVTIYAYRRQMLFEDEVLSSFLWDEWQALPKQFPPIKLDAFVVMPNHIHFVLCLTDSPDPVGVPLAGPPAAPETPPTPRNADEAGESPAPTLGGVVGAYKSRVAVRWLAWIRQNRPEHSARVWERNYYERVVRNDRELTRTREYIAANPVLWRFDSENPARVAEPDYDDAWSWLESST